MAYSDPIPDDALSAARAEYGEDMAVISSPKFNIIVCAPRRAVVKRFLNEAGGANRVTRADALDALFTSVCVYPPASEHAKFLDKCPGAPAECVDHILELSGISAKSKAEK